jgi:acetyl-CoA acetyltransferase
MDDVVIVAAQRTAIGKFGGSLSKIAAADLGAQVIKALLAKTGIKPEAISEVILGQVLTAGWARTRRASRSSSPACPTWSRPSWSARSAAAA